MEYLLGLMEEDMKDNTSTIKKKDMVTFIGLMEGNMRGVGKMENNMELVSIHLQVEKLNRVNGRTERDFNGSTNNKDD
jgi:hypothetical protein